MDARGVQSAAYQHPHGSDPYVFTGTNLSGLWQELFLSQPWVGTEQGAQNLALVSQCQRQVHSVVHL